MILQAVLLATAGFFIGAIPFAVVIGRLVLGEDIRQYGDGNPGTFNVMRAGGLGWGIAVLMLEISKGAFTVGLATYILGITGWPLVLVAVTPPFGHAFSPFLNFKGGKAIASTTGAFLGLSLWEIPLVGITLLVVFYTLLRSSGWAMMFTLSGVLIYMLLTDAPAVWLATWAVLTALLVYKHRHDLTERPRFRQFSSKNDADPIHHNGPDGH